MNIGSVWADNIEDPDNRESIQHGYIKGDGLLGDVVAAVHDLVRIEDELWSSRLQSGPAWLNLYHALKAVEEATK